MAITKPYTFVAGTKAKAVEVNADFDTLYTEANRLGTEILNISVDIQDINSSKADVNGNATQRFQLANPEDSYDGVNKNYLEKSIANVKDYISGFVITKDTDNSIIVSAGSCYDSTFTTMITSTGNITKENLNQSPDKIYYVYIMSDNSGYNVDILITEESTNPRRPDGYDLFRGIGKFTTDEDNKIKYIYQHNSIIPEVKSTVIETYTNWPAWYRIYSDGWCEQGGKISTDNGTITLLKPFANADYTCLCVTTYSRINETFYINNKTTTTFHVQYANNGSWFACGQLAEGEY
jgi:hypothetical protein